MKMLLWKEWRQNRALFMITLAAVGVVWMLPDILFDYGETFTLEMLVMLERGLAVLFATFIGVETFSREAGNGTLSRLRHMPVAPWEVWLAKCAVGLCGVLAVYLMTESAIAFKAYWLGADLSRVYANAFSQSMLIFEVSLFAVGTFTSTFSRRPTEALVYAYIIVVAALFSYKHYDRGIVTAAWIAAEWIPYLVHGMNYNPRPVAMFLQHHFPMAAAPTFLAFAYLVYRYGEIDTELTAPKFRLAAILLVSLAVVIRLFVSDAVVVMLMIFLAALEFGCVVLIFLTARYIWRNTRRAINNPPLSS